jgi:hypothetical protein
MDPVLAACQVRQRHDRVLVAQDGLNEAH